MKNGSKKLKVAVGVSGGVDSTMTAYLLKKQGYEVVGFTMKIWSGRTGQKISGKSACYGPGEKDDIRDAKKAMEKIGVEHWVIDLTKEYEKYVLAYYRKEYLAGKTPNPCVACNQKLKFGFLQKAIFASGLKFDFFATGHYARAKYNKQKNKFLLLVGKDEKKDQAYFLYRLSQKQLKKVIFPLGEMKKEEIKKMAKKFGFAYFADKPESQDFIEEGGQELLFGALPQKSGFIVDAQGKVLGEHTGIHNFTIGQRRGLNVGGMKEPYFVVGIDRCQNKVIAGPRSAVFADTFFLKKTNWIALDKVIKRISAKVKLRSSSAAVECVIIPEKNKLRVKLKEPQFAITAGQSAVFYQKDIVLGGGVISFK